MQSLDLVLRRPTSNLKSNLSKMVIAGATAAALVLTPVLSTMAASGPSSHASLSATYQEGPKIVPASGPGSDDQPVDEADDDDVSEDDDQAEAENEEDEADAEESSALAIEGIIPA
jgi:hypothetical protein